ncbi:MAG: hypothetical protein AVDCRST_MAG77-5354, partial [uncultured Chloroflexi bacterium]
ASRLRPPAPSPPVLEEHLLRLWPWPSAGHLGAHSDVRDGPAQESRPCAHRGKEPPASRRRGGGDTL